MDVTFKKISKLSLFKLLAIGLFIGFFILFTLLGIAALFGANTVFWNGEPVSGVVGLMTAWGLWLMFSLIFTVLTWLVCCLGLWVYSLQGKNLTMKFEAATNEGSDQP